MNQIVVLIYIKYLKEVSCFLPTKPLESVSLSYLYLNCQQCTPSVTMLTSIYKRPRTIESRTFVYTGRNSCVPTISPVSLGFRSRALSNLVSHLRDANLYRSRIVVLYNISPNSFTDPYLLLDYTHRPTCFGHKLLTLSCWIKH